MLEIKRNEKLDNKIKSQGREKKWLAGQINIDPAYLSGFIVGYRIPTPRQREALAEVLGCRVKDIF